MSTLPDLDVSDVSIIAYYNVIDQNTDVDEIDAGSALDYGGLDTYTLYDNGWTGTIDGPTSLDIDVRLKNDGWLVMYLGTEREYGADVGSEEDLKTEAAITGFGSVSTTSNEFTDNIEGILDELDSSDDIIYDGGDESIYSFDHPDATTLALFGKSTTSQDSGSITVNETTEIELAVISGDAPDDSTAEGTDFNGEKIAGSFNVGSINFDDMEVGEEYDYSIDAYNGPSSISVLILYR